MDENLESIKEVKFSCAFPVLTLVSLEYVQAMPAWKMPIKITWVSILEIWKL